MIFDFSKLHLKERPTLILESLSGRIIQTLGYAKDIQPQLTYNEVSTLSFNYPKMVNGINTPHYDDLKGWNIIEWKDLGKFILMDPETTYEDGQEQKSCTAYSLEFEWVFKQIYLEQEVFNFWNPVAPEESVLGRIMELVPHWKLGTVDGSLIGVYHSFDEQSTNLYDFVKSTLQQAVNCIFEFDTMTRTVNVRDVSSRVHISPIYLSTKNLLKQISLNEDSQNIVTSVTVRGAEGVDIMSVNPTGLAAIYNLDYFINDPNQFNNSIIQKWKEWQTKVDNRSEYYYNLSMECDLNDMHLLEAEAQMLELEADLDALERQQTAVIQSDEDEAAKNEQLAGLNSQIAAKKAEIEAHQAAMDEIKAKSDEIKAEQTSINRELDLYAQFTEEEWLELQKYIKEDTIEETTFAYPTNREDYVATQESYEIGDVTCSIGPSEGMPAETPGITVRKIATNDPTKLLYDVEGGYITVDKVSANLIRGSFERNSDGTFVAAFYLGSGTASTRYFKSGTITISGSCGQPTDNTAPDPDVPNTIAVGTTLQFVISSGHLFITDDLTVYQQRSIEWDLLEWGEDTLSKLSSPTYTFSIDSANFLTLDEFDYFRKNLQLGAKCYLELTTGQVLQPILIGVECNYSDLSELTLEFSNSYVSSDPTFQMKDLLEQAVSMGKRVDYSKYTYSSFVDSGAQTAVNEFINSALDTAKNEILSSTDQAITWNGNGMRFRKWNSDHSGYELEQIWAINNQIVFSDDGFDSVKTAIGKIKIGDAWMYGIVAEAIIGRLLAGNNLVIESEKKDASGVSVFKVDGEGASLHNAVFDVYNGNNTHLSINPYFGIAIGKYPVFSDTSDGYVVDEDNAVFWVDLEGNLHIKGTLEVGSDGYFGGIVRAKDYQDMNGNSMLEDIEDLQNGYKFKPDYLNLKGLTIRNSQNQITFQVTGDGHVSIAGDVSMTGGSISWADVGEPPSINEVRGIANSAKNTANNAQNTANNASTTAGNALTSAGKAQDDVLALAGGSYSKAGQTFINRNNIYSPNLYFGTNGNYGSIKPGRGSNGQATTDLIVIHGDKGLRIEAEGGGLAIQAEGDVWSGTGTDTTEWNLGTLNVDDLNVNTIGGRPASSPTLSIGQNGYPTYIRGNVFITKWSTTNDLYYYLYRFRTQINALSTGLTNAGIPYDGSAWQDGWRPPS